jgi:hypothetical protein
MMMPVDDVNMRQAPRSRGLAPVSLADVGIYHLAGASQRIQTC